MVERKTWISSVLTVDDCCGLRFGSDTFGRDPPRKEPKPGVKLTLFDT